MKKQLLIFAALMLTVAGNAQKRNMFPAYNFEVTGENIIGTGSNGQLITREVFAGGDITASIADGITGKSLMVEIKAMPTSNTRWDNALKYFVEVNPGDELEIRFKAQANAETAFDFEVYTASGTGNGILGNQLVEVDSEAKEYVFRTVASTDHTIQRLTFQFGSNTACKVGDIFYFDDLSIIKTNTDWDGNLARNGGFEINSLNYSFLNYNDADNHHNTSFDNADALGSGQSLKFECLRSGSDYMGNLKSFYVGPGIRYKVSYKAKNSGQTGGGVKVGIGRTWDISGNMFPIGTYKNDGFAWQPALSTTTQECIYTYDEALDRDGYNNHFALNFGWYPVGSYWIDDLDVEQIGLKTIEIVEWEKTNSTTQLWINAYPSSADNKVEWEIDPSSTGEASIDADGLVTATKSGDITVNATSTLNSAVITSKTLSFDISTTSIDNQELNSVVIGCEYYSITGVNLGSSKENLREGVYICKEKYDNGTIKKSKIYISKK